MSTTMMIPWLHFGNTDHLIFKAWRPSSPGAVAGACVGLSLLCIFERCLAAYRRTQELRWRAKFANYRSIHSQSLTVMVRTTVTSSKVHSGASKEDGGASTDGPVAAQRQYIPPFIPSHDIPRGVIQAVQSTLSYVLMLSIMTFNAAYIISVILGLGVGEALFGRIGRNHGVPLSVGEKI